MCIHHIYPPPVHPSQPHVLFLFSVLLVALWVQLMLPICTWICGHTLGHKQPINGHLHKRERLSLPQQPSAVKSFSDRGGASGDPAPSVLELCPARVDACSGSHVVSRS